MQRTECGRMAGTSAARHRRSPTVAGERCWKCVRGQKVDYFHSGIDRKLLHRKSDSVSLSFFLTPCKKMFARPFCHQFSLNVSMSFRNIELTLCDLWTRTQLAQKLYEKEIRGGLQHFALSYSLTRHHHLCVCVHMHAPV